MRGLAAGFAALGILACSIVAADGQPSAATHRRALISIVIDDIGYRREDGLRAIELPGDITFAILPHTPHGASIGRLAWQLGKEVILHLPMESRDGHPLGPGGVTAAMSREQFQRTVVDALQSVPNVVGVSNHMGSLLTTDRLHMQWLMQTLGHDSGLYFLDSRTTQDSVAVAVAIENGIPTLARDIFLDNVRDVRLIRRQFFELVRHARAHGRALAIGHPFPETVQVLAEVLPELESYGVELVPVSRLRLAGTQTAPSTLQAAADNERTPR